MHDVELELAHQRIASAVDATPSWRIFLSKYSRVAPCGLDADKNFAVLEREHVSRPRLSEKLPMQKRHAPIGNQPHEDLRQVAQIASFPLSQVQTVLEGIRCEPFKLSNIHRNFSLTIPHANAGKGTPHFAQVGAISFPAASMSLIVHPQIRAAMEAGRPRPES